jgi:hypothetical protein
MSQDDVLEVLRARPDYWFTMKEIKDALKAEGKSNGTLIGAYNDVYKLVSYGFIEVKGVGIWKHYNTFRII